MNLMTMTAVIPVGVVEEIVKAVGANYEKERTEKVD